MKSVKLHQNLTTKQKYKLKEKLKLKKAQIIKLMEEMFVLEMFKDCSLTSPLAHTHLLSLVRAVLEHLLMQSQLIGGLFLRKLQVSLVFTPGDTKLS